MVTSIEELKESAFQEIDLPPFKDGAPFRAKVKRAGISDMVYNGRIANPLLNIAFGLVDDNDTEDSENKKDKKDEKDEKDKKDKKTPEEMLETVKFVMSIVESCLIEPSYKDIKDAGIDLTDNQLIAIQSFALYGIEQAKKFCKSP